MASPTQSDSDLSRLEKSAIDHIDSFIDDHLGETEINYDNAINLFELVARTQLPFKIANYIQFYSKEKITEFLTSRSYLWKMEIAYKTLKIKKVPPELRAMFICILDYVQKRSIKDPSGARLKDITCVIGEKFPTVKQELGKGFEGVKSMLLLFPQLFTMTAYDPKKVIVEEIRFTERARLIDGVILLASVDRNVEKTVAESGEMPSASKVDSENTRFPISPELKLLADKEKSATDFIDRLIGDSKISLFAIYGSLKKCPPEIRRNIGQSNQDLLNFIDSRNHLWDIDKDFFVTRRNDRLRSDLATLLRYMEEKCQMPDYPGMKLVNISCFLGARLPWLKKEFGKGHEVVKKFLLQYPNLFEMIGFEGEKIIDHLLFVNRAKCVDGVILMTDKKSGQKIESNPNQQKSDFRQSTEFSAPKKLDPAPKTATPTSNPIKYPDKPKNFLKMHQKNSATASTSQCGDVWMSDLESRLNRLVEGVKSEKIASATVASIKNKVTDLSSAQPASFSVEKREIACQTDRIDDQEALIRLLHRNPDLIKFAKTYIRALDS